ncbi:MAG: aminotransferase class V-fold PLP-dependent enzyme [Candidatus Eiseniibacteriota bacterium]
MLNRRGFVRSLAALVAAPPLALSPGEAPAASPARATAWPADTDPDYWDRIRAQFDLRADGVFFNTATLGAPPRAVVDAVARSMRDLTSTLAEWDYKPDHPNWFTGYSAENPIRRKLAGLVHAEVEELALTQNATMGLNFVALGLDLARGDEIIQTDQEHVGAKSCWELLQKRREVVWKTVTLPVPADDPEEIVRLVDAAITPRTRVIAWPHITSALGVVHPVAEICALARRRGIFTVIDGAQAIGQIPVDVRAIGCDAYVGSPHKWLLAPAGNGFLYVRKDAASRVWTTLASGEWANEKDPGLRLQQRGTGNLPLLVGLDAAIDFHLRVGPERWFGRIRQLGDYLRARLRELPGAAIASSTRAGMCAGMTTWRLGDHPPYEMVDRIWETARIRPRAVSGAWGMRTSTMIYNSEREIDRLIAAAQAVARTMGG